MAVKKILFCFYPLFVHYNHGIALLSRLCKDRGIETSLYILDTVSKFRGHLNENEYDYIGFSCCVEKDFEASAPFIHAAKETGKPVLLGGVYIRRGKHGDSPYSTAPFHSAGKLGQSPPLYVCRGEGETLPDFILNGDDRLFTEKLLCDDIGSLPLPDYGLFRNIPFDRKISFLDGKKVLPYYSSRGCPFHCSFCEVQAQPRGVRIRERVEEDLSALARLYKPDIFFIGDELLPYYSEGWRRAWGDFHYPFTAYIRADISEMQLRWLHGRGLAGCAFGIESGDEKYRNEVLKKGLYDRDI